MMLLQAPEAVQVGQWAVSLTTLGLVLRLTFSAGKLVEKVDGHDWRITAHDKRLENLEASKCPHPECPLLRGHVTLVSEHEG
jgi:hypothetical protein